MVPRASYARLASSAEGRCGSRTTSLNREQQHEFPALPLGVKSFTFGTVQSAVKDFEAGGTRNEVSKSARLEPKEATRARHLVDGGNSCLSISKGSSSLTRGSRATTDESRSATST